MPVKVIAVLGPLRKSPPPGQPFGVRCKTLTDLHTPPFSFPEKDMEIFLDTIWIFSGSKLVSCLLKFAYKTGLLSRGSGRRFCARSGVLERGYGDR